MLFVQKFGGTSVGSIERIMNVARLLLDTQKKGHEVVGVVSAMSGETNKLVALANAITPHPFSKEYDMLVASGEQVSVALVAMAINSLGGKAKGFLGHQLGIVTDNVPTKARIKKIDTSILRAELARGVIPIVAGFQGVDEDGNITTLGRGGSDTSAVAVAAALLQDGHPGEVDCEIYTDVDGVYTTDPRMCPNARKISKITYDEMMELASLGAKVLQIRSVELASKYKVPLHVRSSFDLVEGTRVVAEDSMLENIVVSGIACDLNDTKITVSNLRDVAGVAQKLFNPLAQHAIVVDVIVQSASDAGSPVSVSFTVPKTEAAKAVEVVESSLRGMFPEMKITTENNLAKVSVVGEGMRHHPGVAAKMFDVLAENNISIRLISTSEIKITVLVDVEQHKLAVNKLHTAFGLDK